MIVSLASSSLEDSPRGAAFLLNKSRLNVASCRTIEEMGLVNLLAKLRHHSMVGARPSGRVPGLE